MEKKTIATLGLFALFLVIVHACTRLDDSEPDGRLGELGKVRFSGPGGCDSSTDLVLGSRAVITLEPQEGSLPADLTVRSSEPAVIAATSGSTLDEIVLDASDAGESNIELVSSSEVYDWLGFGVEPAASVTYTAPDAVFAGGTYFLKIDEVLGECGEECPLIGGEFMDWSFAPADAFALDREVERTVFFTAGAAASATLTGAETTGTTLVDHPVEIVATDAAGELDVRILVYLPSEELLDPQPPPISVPVGSLLQFQFFAEAGGSEVPISRFEVECSLSGDTGALEVYTLEELESPEGPVYSTPATGSVSLHADVALIGASGDFDLDVTSE